MSETILLATFTNKRNFNNVIKTINEFFTVASNKVFVLRDVDNPFKTILTYNIIREESVHFNEIVENTISLHRKKETNTLFTLNGLNAIVRLQSESDDVDPEFAVDWSDYVNCIVLTSEDEELRRINTELIKVVSL